MKTINILTALLVVSILANVVIITMFVPYRQDTISNLVEKTNALEMENIQLRNQLDQDNISLQSYSSQLAFYRGKSKVSESINQSSIFSLTGFASIQAPAVAQHIVQVNRGRFLNRNIVMNGSMMNLSVEIRPGEGRVLVQTTPLMGVVFQDAANTAVDVAQNKTGISLTGSDVIFSIEAENQISSVDGPSAGALMTLATISAIEKRPIDQNITLTGTIDKDGHVGAVGGVIEKANVAKENGKTLFLIPRENEVLINYKERVTNYYGFQLIERIPEEISAKDYIEKSTGINVAYVDIIDDILSAGLK